ncbi:MAG: hypothetical protein U0168_09045 [Nannocystaceae bacterium]
MFRIVIVEPDLRQHKRPSEKRSQHGIPDYARSRVSSHLGCGLRNDLRLGIQRLQDREGIIDHHQVDEHAGVDIATGTVERSSRMVIAQPWKVITEPDLPYFVEQFRALTRSNPSIVATWPSERSPSA